MAVLGQHFKPGIVYLDGDRWLRVASRGPLITRGVNRPLVRMTAQDADGVVHRVKVYAGQLYRTAGSLPGESVSAKPMAPRRRIIREYIREYQDPDAVAPVVPVQPARRTVPAVRPGRATGKRKKSRPHVKIVKQDMHYCTEACYWLPPKTGSLSPTLYDVVEAMSELPWNRAADPRWDRDGTLVEHEEPAGYALDELTRRVYHVAQPNDHQTQTVERSLTLLRRQNVVERSPIDSERFRLRGWQCLHTRRRTTRLAIERGGGRAVYATVRFSA